MQDNDNYEEFENNEYENFLLNWVYVFILLWYNNNVIKKGWKK